MTKHNAKERPRSGAKASSSFLYGALVAIVLISIGGFLYWQYFSPKLAEHRQSPVNGAGQTTVSPPPASGLQAELPQQSVLPAPTPGDSSPQDGAAGDNKPPAEINETDTHSPAEADPQQLISELNAFYTHLDQQAYMRDFGLKEPSKVHFSKLLQKLVDNPPVVIRETDDLLTLLKNTAHFYRILDKENITILKGILDRDRKSLEQILKTFYALTYHPEYLKKEYSLTLPLDSLHDYAAFFLNTIGGRLYLFRRDSASRMTVSYYAILVIDRANQEGNNPHGIDLRPAIDSLIEEIENTGKNLKFRNEYLDHLYDLKEQYN